MDNVESTLNKTITEKINPELLEVTVDLESIDQDLSSHYARTRVHKCTEEEWNKFWPPRAPDAQRMESMRKRNKMYCPNNIDNDGKPFFTNKIMFG